jgi:hypothetical protein
MSTTTITKPSESSVGLLLSLRFERGMDNPRELPIPRDQDTVSAEIESLMRRDPAPVTDEQLDRLAELQTALEGFGIDTTDFPTPDNRKYAAVLERRWSAQVRREQRKVNVAAADAKYDAVLGASS